MQFYNFFVSYNAKNIYILTKIQLIIDWKKITSSIYSRIKKEIESFDKKPILWVILVWEELSSVRYVKQKEKFASFCWMWFALKKLKRDVSEKELIDTINEYNNDRNVSGYIVQLPLPKHIDTNKILEAINPKKDVDGFSPENMGKTVVWDNSGFVPCTPLWIIEIFKYLDINPSGKIVTIIWKSNIVWKPMAALLMNAWATVTICNSRTPSIGDFTTKSDVVITAAWKPNLLTLDMLNSKTLVIDVWFTVEDWRIMWDADFENINIAWIDITPVPFGVWPLTVAMLMKNTLKAYKRAKILESK